MKPQYVEFDQFGVLAICGLSGSGKSSTTRFLLAQLAMCNVGLIVCDPHGSTQTDNLATTIIPLSKSMILPTAISMADRMRNIQYVAKLFNDRVNGADSSQKVVLVLDEAPLHFMQCSAEEVHQTATLFLRLANEGRKTNIRVLLLGQNWKSDFVGSRSIRSSITHVLFHRSSEDEIKLFAPSMPAQHKREIAQLKTGYAYMYPDMIRVQIPLVTQDDLIAAQHLYKPYVQTDDLLSTLLHVNSTPLESQKVPIARMHDVARMHENEQDSGIARACKQIIAYYREGLNKEQTIKRVFKTYKSSTNKRWRAASKLYDEVIKRYG